jgi:hypothetical protein
VPTFGNGMAQRFAVDLMILLLKAYVTLLHHHRFDGLLVVQPSAALVHGRSSCGLGRAAEY